MRAVFLSLLLASCTGEFEEPRKPLPPVPAPRHTLAINDDQSCVIDSDRHVACWTETTKPAIIPRLENVEQLVAGEHHACALDRAGNVHCWGKNENGEIGDGTDLDRALPVWVVTDAVQIAAGHHHTCAVLRNKTVACWGLSINGGRQRTLRATHVDGLPPIRSVATSSYVACALDETGTPWCWGTDSFGLRGNGWGNITAKGPTAIESVGGMVEIAIGDRHACARRIDGAVTCWGDNDRLQVGSPKGWPTTTWPRSVDGLRAEQLALGHNHSCALENAHVRCWGSNILGERGDAKKEDAGVPGVVAGLSGVLEIAANEYRTCAVLGDGTVRCWGGEIR